MFLSLAARAYHTDMAAALPRFRGCPCTNPAEKQFPAIYYVPLRGEFELPTAGDVEWLLFSYT